MQDNLIMDDAWQDRLELARAVARRLEAQYGCRMAAKELLAFAKDKKWEVRAEAAMAMRFLSPMDLDAFLPLLEDECAIVQEHARRSMEARRKEDARLARRSSAGRRDARVWASFAREFGAEAARKAREITERAYADAIGGVTHDMRSLLRPLFPALDRLEERDVRLLEPKDAQEARRDLCEMRDRLRLVSQVVEDSRELSLDIDCSNPRTDTVAALLKEALAQVKAELDSLPQPVPMPPVGVDCPASLTVTAPLLPLVRAFRNLLKNAVEACLGREDGHVQAVVTQRGNVITVLIQDNGPGIPPDELKAYNSFRPHCATRKSGGTGFGLAIANAKLRAIGGSLALESEEGKGTTAIVKLMRNGGIK